MAEPEATSTSSSSAATPAKPSPKPATPAAKPAPGGSGATPPSSKPAGKPAGPGGGTAPAPAKPRPSAGTPGAPAKPSVVPSAGKPAAKKVDGASGATSSATSKPSKPAHPPAAAKPAVVVRSKWEKARPERPKGPAPKVIDASGLVLGRAASLLAKRLLQGETLVVVNTESAVVLGGYADVIERYRLAVARGSVRKGPHYPRRPDRIFRRTVRGMLPFKHTKGREAFARILTYVGVPSEFQGMPKETLEGARVRPSLRPPLTLGEVSRRVGGVGPW